MELSYGECDVFCILCVALLTVIFNCLVKQFAICLGVVAILLLNVMGVFSAGGGALLDIPCIVFQRMCVLCLLSQCISNYSLHRFCLCFVCRKLSPHLRVCSPYVVSLCDFAYYVVG